MVYIREMDNLKIVLLAFCRMTGKSIFAQHQDSIVYLDEVRVATFQQLKEKLPRTSTVGFYENEKLVSLVKEIPAGEIAAITFFLQTKHHDKAEHELRLLIYEKDVDGKPGTSLIPANLHFKISGNSKGQITVDLEDLHIKPRSEFFVGFETIKLSGGIFMADLQKDKNAISYGQKAASDWIMLIRRDPMEIRMITTSTSQ